MCEIKVLAVEPCSKKGSRDEAVGISSGSAVKSHSTTTQYRQLRRLVIGRLRMS